VQQILFKKVRDSTLFDVHLFLYFASPTENNKESQRVYIYVNINGCYARQPVNTRICPYARIFAFCT